MSTTLGNVSVGTTVKIKVNGALKEFKVIHQGYPDSMYSATCDGTWLWYSGNYKNVNIGSETSPADNYSAKLDSEFTTFIDPNILPHVKTVKIPYVQYTPSKREGVIVSGENGFSTKAFFLCMYEVGLSQFDSRWPMKDGVKLSYFEEGETTSAKNKRKNGYTYWSRTPNNYASGYMFAVDENGAGSSEICIDNPVGYYEMQGVRPAIIVDPSLYVLDDGTISTNAPPTAPGSIRTDNVVRGQNATITLTAATDPNGSIASYIYERSVDGAAWEQFANVNSLTCNDTVGNNWGTVAYRAKAVDDKGASGPYITGETTVVNSGFVLISGPAKNMGSKPAPFSFDFSTSVSGMASASGITVDVTMDGKIVYSQSVSSGAPISIKIDTRVMRTGNHSIVVAASCADYVGASSEYTFSVPDITIPDGGRLEQLEAQDGQTIFPVTLARAVVGLENYGVESKIHPGAYTGTGTYGSGNQNRLEFEFEPKLVIIQGTSGRIAVLNKPSGSGVSMGGGTATTLTVSWSGNAVSWYNGVNAANQMNTSNEEYSYTAFG